MRRYPLRDDQWERSKDPLPGREGWVGVTAKDDRLLVDAVPYRCRAGTPWRDPPGRFGAWKKVHTRFCRWAGGGVRKRAFGRPADEAAEEHARLDSTTVRAHRHSAGAVEEAAGATGRSGAAGAGRARRATPPSTRSATRPGSRSRRDGRTTRRAPPRRCRIRPRTR